jgi:hypothetical protein
MDTSHISGLLATAAEFFSATPGQAAWLQAVGTLIALITVSLVPWLKGRARQRAFLLRGRLLVQEAGITLADIGMYVDLIGFLQDKKEEIRRIRDEFKSFPFEELSVEVGTAFHRCRIAFLNMVVTFEELHPHEGVLPPRSRMHLLHRVLTFQYAFEESRGAFDLVKFDKRKPSKAEREIQATVEARKEEFEAEYKAYLERSQKVTAQSDAAPTPPTDSDGSAPT